MARIGSRRGDGDRRYGRLVVAQQLAHCAGRALDQQPSPFAARAVHPARAGPSRSTPAPSLAREQGLENPAQLFVDPRLWEPSRMGSLGKRYAAQLGRLQQRIFEL